MTQPSLIGVTACVREIDGLPGHGVQDTYLRTLSRIAGALPVIIPALADALALDALLDRLDGVLVTGSRSDIDPDHYEQPPAKPDALRDPGRDGTTLPLIRRALELGVPLLAICRGCQEMNVALGGSLHQHIPDLPQFDADHCANPGSPIEQRYAPRHTVTLTPGGRLHRLLDVTEISVNSAHRQGVDRLAPSLMVEAIAPDGLPEAVAPRPGAAGYAGAFALGVQWHPEWLWQGDPHAATLFRAFAAAAALRAAGRISA